MRWARDWKEKDQLKVSKHFIKDCKYEQKKIKVGGINCGEDQLFLISGPCVIEDESVMMKTAEKLKEVGAKLNIPIIYKSSFLKDNRSSFLITRAPG